MSSSNIVSSEVLTSGEAIQDDVLDFNEPEVQTYRPDFDPSPQIPLDLPSNFLGDVVMASGQKPMTGGFQPVSRPTQAPATSFQTGTEVPKRKMKKMRFPDNSNGIGTTSTTTVEPRTTTERPRTTTERPRTTTRPPPAEVIDLVGSASPDSADSEDPQIFDAVDLSRPVAVEVIDMTGGAGNDDSSEELIELEDEDLVEGILANLELLKQRDSMENDPSDIMDLLFEGVSVIDDNEGVLDAIEDKKYPHFPTPNPRLRRRRRKKNKKRRRIRLLNTGNSFGQKVRDIVLYY